MTEEHSGQKTEQGLFFPLYSHYLLCCNICCSVQSTIPNLQVSETGLEAFFARDSDRSKRRA